MSKPFDPEHAAAHGYTRKDWDEVASPELSEEELAGMRPMSEAMPDLHAALVKARKPGPPRTKTPISIRLDIDLVDKLRASGPGWQARVNDAVRRMVDDDATPRSSSKRRRTG